jgi:hypothetical protein
VPAELAIKFKTATAAIRVDGTHHCQEWRFTHLPMTECLYVRASDCKRTTYA